MRFSAITIQWLFPPLTLMEIFMDRKKSFATRMGRLVQSSLSSILIGVAMALVVSPPCLETYLYANYGDCEAARVSAIKAADQSRQVAYNACNAAYDNAAIFCSQTYDNDAATCAMVYVAAFALATATYIATGAGCVWFGPACLAIVAIAAALYVVTQAIITAALAVCMVLANQAYQNCMDKATKDRDVCLKAANRVYDIAVRQAEEQYEICVAGCGG